MTPQNNLGVQTQIAAGAKAFVGTCGSLTWLVPRLGVDTSARLRRSEVAARPPAGGDARRAQAGRRALRRRRPAGARSVAPWPRAASRDAREGRLHRAALHLLPQLRVGGRRRWPSAGTPCTSRRTAKRRSAGASWWTGVAAAHPRHVTVGFTPILQWGRYRRLAGALRLGLDYLRYSDPRYDTTPQIRERAYERTPLFVLVLARAAGRGALVVWALERLEQAVPAPARHRRVPGRAAARRPAGHAAHRAGVAAARLRARRARARHPQRACACGAGTTCPARR